MGLTNTFRQWRESLQMLRGLVARRTDPAAFYNLIGEHNNLCDRSRYANLGYWVTAKTYDEAGEAMAEFVGQRLGLGAGARVLDAGCGFADQDMFWIQRHAFREIQAVNISSVQAAAARQRIAAAGLADRIEIVRASATELPFPAASFDGVISIEAAMHFDPRDQFFREAARVLRPGGRIAIADCATITPVATWPWPARVFSRAMWRSIHIPAANMYPAAEYAQRMEAGGFRNVEVISIREQVYPGFGVCAQRELARPEVRRRVNPVLRAMWLAMAKGDTVHDHRYGDYIVATGTR